MEAISITRVQEVLRYDEASGTLYWKTSSSNRAPAGTRAGTLRRDGRWQVRIDGRIYLSHRVIWALANGRWPENVVDHKNLRPSENGLENLRSATLSQNAANSRVRKNNKLKIKGVRRHWTGRFEAYITVNRRQIYLGGYSSASEAAAAYLVAAKVHYGEFARAV